MNQPSDHSPSFHGGPPSLSLFDPYFQFSKTIMIWIYISIILYTVHYLVLYLYLVWINVIIKY